MKRLLMVGALGVLLVLGVSTVASAAPSFGSSTLGGTPPGTNIALIASSNLLSQTYGHHGMETLVFSQTGGFGGGPLNGGGFEQQIVVQFDSENGEFTYTGTGILSGPLVGATTVKLAQGFTTIGEGEVPMVVYGVKSGVENVVDDFSFSAASLFQDSIYEATILSDSKTANVSIELGTLEVPDGLAAMTGINLIEEADPAAAALLPPGAVAAGPYGASWVIH
jgi:hypothetical protein